jgi:hypothetical protein
MMNRMKRWLVYTLAGIISGSILGYILLWGWFFFRLMVLGYGDSGPSWINTVNDIVFFAGLVIGITGSQLLFVSKEKRN